jgi:hypothetical protein
MGGAYKKNGRRKDSKKHLKQKLMYCKTSGKTKN